MQQKTIATFECEIVQKELKLVGQSITANFPDSFPDAAIKVQEEFLQRTDEIHNAKHKEILFSPFMCNEIIATYFACLEVDEIDQIPEGMIGFKLPMTKYAKISCSNKTISEGYDAVYAWMQEHGYKEKWFNHSSPVEIYYIDENAEEEPAEILIPIY
ncbi:effector binding domain-containing protein [Siminovitchia fortis]|uniref:AraC family transcriptional regulator n=1 Tax=Siminovitchia fortis TaxID=254758 RepID=A0A443IMT3_9BACI|nr:effector binding domain-containing protein [Siminovitchia fortis]RWR06538.1 AraC family transcriptional regulator [Siminovitchia fortis]WHY80834.1 effector binding domain-containing protein [Siminovitchia fortis]